MASTKEMQRRAKVARQAAKAASQTNTTVKVKTMSAAFEAVFKEMHSGQWDNVSGEALMQQGKVWARRVANCPEYEKKAFIGLFFKM